MRNVLNFMLSIVLLHACVEVHAQENQNVAFTTIYIPESLQLTINNAATKKTGSVRQFSTGELDPTKTYIYVFVATWNEGEELKTARKELKIRAGDRLRLSFWDVAIGQNDNVVIAETNRERGKQGLSELQPNEKLMRAAKKHAENMAAQQKLAHDLDRNSFVDRAQVEGYQFMNGGENIAEGALNSVDVVGMWMRSPGHRQNIMNGEFKEIGVGHAFDKNGRRFDVQVFGTSMKVTPSKATSAKLDQQSNCTHCRTNQQLGLSASRLRDLK